MKAHWESDHAVETSGFYRGRHSLDPVRLGGPDGPRGSAWSGAGQRRIVRCMKTSGRAAAPETM